MSISFAWGANNIGQLGDGTYMEREEPVAVQDLTDVAAIAAGIYHNLAVLSDGTVRAWGLNGSGQLGDGTNDDSNVPVAVQNLTDVIAIAGGGSHSLALLSDGTVRAWGYNEYGQLGNGTNNDSNVPVSVVGINNIIAIAGGYEHSLAIQQSALSVICTADITVSNTQGQCGAVVEYPEPEVIDDCPEGYTIVCGPPSGSFFPVGETTVTCTLTDPCGNEAFCSFVVTVNDTEPPVITRPEDIIVLNDPGSTGAYVHYPELVVADNCPSDITIEYSPPSGSFFLPGTTRVTCTAIDASGNSSTCSFNVKVIVDPCRFFSGNSL